MTDQKESKEQVTKETSPELRRIDGRYVFEEIASVLTFKKGIFFTIWELLIRPGKNVKAFITEDRNRLVKPVIFVIFCSFIYTILQQYLHFEDGYIKFESEEGMSTSVLIFKWIQQNYGYANILMAMFIAFWLNLLFRKSEFNFYEALILLLFLFGILMLQYALFGVLEVLSGAPVLQVGAILSFIYSVWAIGQFYGGRKFISYFKAFLAYFLGFISFTVLAILLGVTIDTVI